MCIHPRLGASDQPCMYSLAYNGSMSYISRTFEQDKNPMSRKTLNVAAARHAVFVSVCMCLFVVLSLYVLALVIYLL